MELVWTHCISLGNSSHWRVREHLPLCPQGKPQHLLWINLDLCQQYHRCKFELIWAGGSNPGRGLEYGMCWCRWFPSWAQSYLFPVPFPPTLPLCLLWTYLVLEASWWPLSLCLTHSPFLIIIFWLNQNYLCHSNLMLLQKGSMHDRTPCCVCNFNISKKMLKQKLKAI